MPAKHTNQTKKNKHSVYFRAFSKEIMTILRKKFSILTFGFFISLCFYSGIFAQSAGDFLGVRLRPEIQTVRREIVDRTGKEIYADFLDQKDFQFGSSYITNQGVAVVLIDFSLRDEREKLEAVIAHELLHLRLRVNNYPTFLFSPTVQTARGRALDTEQSNVTDLNGIIEHRIFKPEMQRLGLSETINLAGDTAESARRRKGEADSQSDSINYARAILEYQTAADIEEVKKLYQANRWTRSLETGKAIADLINQSNLQTPQAVEAVFIKCLLKLYPLPPARTFKLTADPKSKFYRRMIISQATPRQTVRRKKR